MSRTMAWYAEHPRAFESAVEAWQGRELERYLDAQERIADEHIARLEADEVEEAAGYPRWPGDEGREW